MEFTFIFGQKIKKVKLNLFDKPYNGYLNSFLAKVTTIHIFLNVFYSKHHFML